MEILFKLAFFSPRISSSEKKKQGTFFQQMPSAKHMHDNFCGTHVIVYSHDAEKDRKFFHDVFGFDAVDSGGGWLIHALPNPSEMAFHPTRQPPAPGSKDSTQTHANAKVYLAVKSIGKFLHDMKAKKVECEGVVEAPFGSYTNVPLPSGAKLGVYEPKHIKPAPMSIFAEHKSPKRQSPSPKKTALKAKAKRSTAKKTAKKKKSVSQLKKKLVKKAKGKK